jgi:hypothetical protein
MSEKRVWTIAHRMSEMILFLMPIGRTYVNNEHRANKLASIPGSSSGGGGSESWDITERLTSAGVLSTRTHADVRQNMTWVEVSVHDRRGRRAWYRGY